MRIWSLYQEAIFEFVQNGNGNAVIEAVPGSGKSTTLVEALNYIPKSLHESTLFLAFSKKIVKDLQGKTPPGITCSTFHSFCLQVIKAQNPNVKVDRKGEKIKKIISSLVGGADDELRELLTRAISLAKAYLAHDTIAIERVMEKHEIDSPRMDFSQLVLKALDMSAAQFRVVDFDDMIWFISRFNMPLPYYAYVMVDEAQDCNPGRIDVLRRLLNQSTCALSSTRIFPVGDKNQVIFQFAGSCEDSMEQLRKVLGAESFPLTVSYRCAKAIVAEARRYVPGIEASPDAEDGVVETVSKARMIAEAGPGDFIISRINAPLAALCLSLLMKGKHCNIQGRDMGKTFNYMIKLSKADTTAGFLSYVYEWSTAQFERINKRKGGDSSHIQDRVACLEVLCDGTNDLTVVKSRIKKLFAEVDRENPGDDKIICTSAHRAKGLEKNRVWVLSDTFKPGKSVEENNLMYVAVTRAKTHLYLVTDD